MKQIIFLLFSFASFISASQNDWNLKASFSGCNSNLDPNKLKDRIASYHVSNNHQKIELSFKYSCEQSFEPKIKIDKNTIKIDLIDTVEADAWCGDCCYTIELEFEYNKKLKHFYLWDKEIYISDDPYKIVPIKFDLINGKKYNYSDEHGFRQGEWFIQDRPNNKNGYDSVHIVYKNDEVISSFYHKEKTNISYITDGYESFTIYKKDTLNYIDLNGLKQGVHTNIIGNYRRPVLEYWTFKDNRIIEGHIINEGHWEVIFHNNRCLVYREIENDHIVKECDCRIIEPDFPIYYPDFELFNCIKTK